MSSPKRVSRFTVTLAGGVVALLSALAGCAGRGPKPGDSLVDAELAVARAEQARVADYDAASLRSARENLAAAQMAAASGNETSKDVLSRWYASRAKVDAELGLAHAEGTRYRAIALTLQREIDTVAAAALAPVPSTSSIPPPTEH